MFAIATTLKLFAFLRMKLIDPGVYGLRTFVALPLTLDSLLIVITFLLVNYRPASIATLAAKPVTTTPSAKYPRLVQNLLRSEEERSSVTRFT